MNGTKPLRMNTKTLMKGLFQRFGYNIVRFSQPETLEKLPPQPMNFYRGAKPLHIEFMGSSGVGKTTLFRELQKLRNQQSQWITPDEFFSLNYLEPNSERLDDVYEKFLASKIDVILSGKMQPSDQLKLLCFFYRNMKEDAAVRQRNKNYAVIFEDGLFHNFSNTLLTVFETEEPNFRSIVEDSAIVYCVNSAEIVAEQILERKSSQGVLHPHHNFCSRKELEKYQIKQNEEIDKLIEFLRQFSCPVLKIDTSQNLAENAKKVELFVNRLIRQIN